MTFHRPQPSGRERRFADDDLIVSKTDPRGRITYANRVFIDMSGYTEEELLGRPHSLIRHPDMPRCVFSLLWTTIQGGDEIFAYVKNLCKNGDHYWVFAHVTPTFDGSGRIIGYHSNRRAPERAAIEAIAPVYADLLAVERRSATKAGAITASTGSLQDLLRSKGVSYGQLVFAL